jgi:hypothetical protein
MHYMSYVLVPKTEASSSLEARQYVMEELTDDPSFMGEGGRFFEPVCDWFVTGGRWSGRLCPKTIRDEFWKQANQLLEPERYGYLGIDESEIQANRKQLDTIWQKLGGKHNSPLTRDQYRPLGEDDDACIMPTWLVPEFNVYLHESDLYDVDPCSINRHEWVQKPIVISLEQDLLYNLKDFKQVVGKYWVVVIDYHT